MASSIHVGTTTELAAINGTSACVDTAFVGTDLWLWDPSNTDSESSTVLGSFAFGRWLKQVAGGGGGSGDVTGPAGATAGSVALLDATGKVLSAGPTAAQLRDRSTHTGTQAISTVTGLQTALDAKAAGAASSTDNALPRFDGTDGKTLQGSSVIVSDANAVSGVASLDVTGNITVGGNVDGRDVSADGTVLDTVKVGYLGVNDQTGTSYTPVLGDGGKLITMSNAASNTFTVPPNSSVAYPIGTVLGVLQKGAGNTTIAQGSGVTVNPPNGRTLAIRAQWCKAHLTKIDTNVWHLDGDVT